MAKKATKSTAKKATSKLEISGKGRGRNIILVIQGTTHSKSFKTKEERTEIWNLVEGYNKRNSLAKEKKIIKLMAKETLESKKKEAKKAVKKVAKKAESVKKIVEKPLTKAQEIAKAKALLEKEGMTVSTTTPVKKRKRGEY